MTISRMIYVDDSGTVQQNLIVYGWIEVEPARWRHGLRTLLELRKDLFREHKVPVATELHATKFINGRMRISTQHGADAERDELRALGQAVAVQCLETLHASGDVRFGAVWRGTDAEGRDYFLERGKVYQTLVGGWNDEHRDANDHAFVCMDGNGSDRTYFNAHRALPLDTRHIIEDPMMHDSGASQWVQMADLIAYTAYSSLNRHQGNQFAWNWYDDFIKPKDVNGGLKRL